MRTYRYKDDLGWIRIHIIHTYILIYIISDFLKYMEIKAEQYKTPFISWMGMKCFLYVNDPQTMETIFNSACCINKGDLYHFIASAIGDGLFTSSCK